MKHVEEFDSTLAGVGVMPEPDKSEISSLASGAIRKAKFRLMPLILLMYLLAFYRSFKYRHGRVNHESIPGTDA
ncbi:Uncharacterised protein [Leclercia adecarboxylata]|uniref:Uncharacterized protein n=1 Tax=Leclercia adecarboxylata TaxID=83655 RepID=A0A4U9HPH6_9ENTR|nr:Uncharacterised protein [Leclercia adecarboxylata]